MHVLSQITKIICSELKSIASTKYGETFLRNTNQGLYEFSWDCIFAELVMKLPTLTKLLISLFGNFQKSKAVIS
jgi:hypothetical protein